MHIRPPIERLEDRRPSLGDDLLIAVVLGIFLGLALSLVLHLSRPAPAVADWQTEVMTGLLNEADR